MCDRVLFLAHGHIAGEMSRGELEPDRLIKTIFQTAGEQPRETRFSQFGRDAPAARV